MYLYLLNQIKVQFERGTSQAYWYLQADVELNMRCLESGGIGLASAKHLSLQHATGLVTT
ncbi:hypothetical protein J6590_033134 [Homalodisca vitripennis]|nr:hypothetical protein J6590_033134 [Homalodisca vitripennis]